jgi:hypothetical protein
MSKAGIRPLNRPFNHQSDDFVAAWEEIESSTPRAAMILAGAFIDDALRWAIEGQFLTHIRPDDLKSVFEEDSAPLKSFHGKIIIGYSLGIFGPIARKDLTVIKGIRNVFAHAPRSINFDTREIAEECDKLQYLNAISVRQERKIMIPKEPITRSPRDLILATVRVIYLDLHLFGSVEAETLGGMP